MILMTLIATPAAFFLLVHFGAGIYIFLDWLFTPRSAG